MKQELKRRTRIIKDYSITINGEELRRLIDRELTTLNVEPLPPDADIYVQVPGGADWSNEALDINEHPIQVKWTVEKGFDE